MADELPIATPCVKVCKLDLSAPFCVGCFRTLDEIARWRDFSDAQRQVVFEKLPERRSAHKVPDRDL
jgi:predicted Fe-S protein YdhL (DUF1289 family)